MTEEVKQTFAQCVIKQTTHYYKTMLIWGVEGLVLLGIIYGTISISTAVFPMILGATSSVISAIPLWAYIPASLVAIPILVAIIVCRVNRNEVQVSKEDEEYICKE